MAKLTEKKKKWIINQILKGIKKKDIVSAMKVSRMAIWKVERTYKKHGKESFNIKKVGRPFEHLNPKFYNLVIEEWKKNKCGARKLYAVMKRKGFNVSRRKIEQILVAKGFQKPFPKRRKPRKYKRYEWPIPNYMWHTDWHIIKSEKLRGENILVYLDDCSRRIMGYIIGDQTTKNSLLALHGAIAKYKVIPYCLNSDRGTQFMANKFDKNGDANHKFQEALEDLSIIFIPSRARHPQTNGKNKKFFDILDKEFDERFENMHDFIKWYNNVRLSEALDHIPPVEAYKIRL